MIVKFLEVITLVTMVSAAHAVCPQTYAFNTSDKSIIDSKIKASSFSLVKECSVMVKDAVDADAILNGADKFGMLLSAPAISKTSVYKCEVTADNKRFNFFIKIQRFEPIGTKSGDDFSATMGEVCDVLDQPSIKVSTDYMRK